ncbi:MAG: hypothetical protein IKK75_13980 [Clostridia bacterium]|nr:hypothetical protein [Clostridia bacterium]
MQENLTVMKGRDIAAPMESVTFMGQRMPMKFNNRAALVAENVYADHFGRDIGYYAIMTEAAIPKHSALMAMIYGGIVAAGAAVAWEDFEEHFRITDVDGVSEAVHRAVLRSLPDEDPDKDPGDEKNAQTTTVE